MMFGLVGNISKFNVCNLVMMLVIGLLYLILSINF